MSFYNYILNLSTTEIRSIYNFYNSPFNFPEKHGFGCSGAFEFLGSILLAEFDSSIKIQIVELCKKVCIGDISPLQFSDKIDSIIYFLPYITYEEWSAIYRYLRETQISWVQNEWFYKNSLTKSPVMQSIHFSYTTSLPKEIPLHGEIIKVVGVTFENRQNLLAKLQIGELVQLKRDYANPFGSNAITLHNLHNETLGYIPKEKSAILAPYLDAGNKLFGEIVDILGGVNNLYYGFRIKIVD